MKQQQLKEFYKNYFQFNYCRDLRIIYPEILYKEEGTVRAPAPRVLHSNHYRDDTDLTMHERFYRFLFNKKHRNGTGNIYYQVSNYQYLNNYKSKNREIWTDRLYWDLDVKDPRVDKAKQELTRARTTLTGREKVKAEKKAKDEFKDLLLNTDVLNKPFTECKRLYNYLVEKGSKPLVLYSGVKGFAINELFTNLPLKNISKITYKLSTNLQQYLALSTLDLAVAKDVNARMERAPFTVHPNSGLLNQPVDPTVSFDEFLDTISNKKPSVIDLNVTENSYITDLLVKLDKQISFNEQFIPKPKPKPKIALNGDEVDTVFQDCRVLAKILLGPPEKEYSTYNTYLCPFHDDNVASARVYKDNYICSACNKYLRYFEFIRAVKELETGRSLGDDDVKQEMRKIKSLKV